MFYNSGLRLGCSLVVNGELMPSLIFESHFTAVSIFNFNALSSFEYISISKLTIKNNSHIMGFIIL